MRDHRKLRAFELADEVAVLIYRATRGFPKEEIYGLTSQVDRLKAVGCRMSWMFPNATRKWWRPRRF